ncbi:MAG: ribbon-helix-helix domain-containing protein [Nanoarchaeota archaeon]
MKTRVSFTIEEDLDKKLDAKLKDTKYRNKSHLIEIALRKFIEEKND